MSDFMKKVVVLGGGHGLSVLLKGLKLFPLDITAVVSVADDGSSTGILRNEFNIPAVGDLRNVLVSLSESEPILEEILQYRFKTKSDLNNHAVGNLLLTALFDITGSLSSSLDALSKILKIKGRVLPFTEDKAVLVAETINNEKIIGESNITKAGKKIKYLYYQNDIKVCPSVIDAIKSADYIIFGIGSLYTSILPNVLNEEMKKTLINSNAKKIYVCNIMTEHGETDDFSVSDCVKTINKYISNNFIDVVLANESNIPDDIKNRYYSLESSKPILIDMEELNKMNVQVLSEKLAIIKNETVVHDSLKTAFALFTYIMNGDIL